MAAYPRKQTVVIFVICALAVGGVAFYVNSRPNGSERAPSILPVTASLSTSTQTIADTDWQKQFLELSSASSSFSTPNKAKLGNVPEKLTATDLLSRNFFTQYVSLSQSGVIGDPSAVSNAVDQTISSSASGLSGPKTYSLGDVHVVNDSDSAIKNYDSVIVSVSNIYSHQPDEADIAARAFEDSDTGILADIDPIISTYRNLLSRLMSTPVPRSMSSYQVDLLNGFSMLLYSAQAFRHMDTDALSGLAAVRIDAVGTQTVTNA